MNNITGMSYRKIEPSPAEFKFPENLHKSSSLNSRNNVVQFTFMANLSFFHDSEYLPIPAK